MSDSVLIPASLQVDAPVQPHPNVKRHLIAAALSTALPGVGQLFLKRYKRAAFLLASLLVIALGFWQVRLPKSYPGLLFLGWMYILASLFAVFDALLARDPRLPGKMSRWWILFGIPLHYLGFNLGFTALLFGSGFHTMKTSTSSMAPTLLEGDKLVADERYYDRHLPERLDLVIFQTPSGLFVKRVIAVGGDTIWGKEHKVYLNGQLLNEPFAQYTSPEDSGDRFAPTTVPKGEYFVMGDNRDLSFDSRSFGPVNGRAIVGKALYGYHIFDKPIWWQLH